MAGDTIISLLALGVSVISMLTGFYVAGIKNERRIAKLELMTQTMWTRQETMWDFQVRRAVAEAVDKNVATVR